MAIISRICILSCVTLEILAFPNISKRLNQDFYDLLEEEAEDFKNPSNTVYGGLKSGGGKFERTIMQPLPYIWKILIFTKNVQLWIAILFLKWKRQVQNMFLAWYV